MKKDGSDGSGVSAVGVDVPGVCDSHLGTGYGASLDCRLAITPEMMAIPIVPHPITQSVYPMVDGRLENTSTVLANLKAHSARLSYTSSKHACVRHCGLDTI